MLRKIILCSLLILGFACPSFAITNSVDDFIKLSQKQREKIKNTKDFKTKAAELKSLEQEFIATREDLKKKNPENATKEQHNINVFFYVLEPVFAIAKKEKADGTECAQAKRQTTSDGRRGIAETAPMPKDSEEALAWIDLICKK
jgi:hypothetical protein